MKKRKRLYDYAKLTNNPSYWVAYKELKNEVNINLKQAHNAYCNHLFDTTFTSNRKRFWSYIKNLRHDFSDIAILHTDNKEHLTSTDKANALNNQFVSVFTNEDSDIPQLPTNHYPFLQDIIFLLLVLNVF